MNLQQELNTIGGFKNLELLAKQVVEGFIAGMHKSPFHGFSAEFAEHKIYNQGESTRHIDWKLYAKTDKLFTGIIYLLLLALPPPPVAAFRRPRSEGRVPKAAFEP